jgi:hypothetical protein
MAWFCSLRLSISPNDSMEDSAPGVDSYGALIACLALLSARIEELKEAFRVTFHQTEFLGLWQERD